MLRKNPYRLSTRPVGQWLFSQPINYIMLSSMSETAVEKQEYLESLSEDDRANLGLLATTFLEYCGENNLSGAVLIVGGTVKPETRGTRRKDIDILPLISGQSSFESFRVLMNWLEKQTNFHNSKIIEPIIDEEFGNPAILRHTGSITLQPESGSPLEFIRLESVDDWRDVEKGMMQKDDYYSLLVSLEQKAV